MNFLRRHFGKSPQKPTASAGEKQVLIIDPASRIPHFVPEDSRLDRANDAYNKGNQCANDEDYPNAIAYYEKALALDPTIPSFYNNLATAQKRLGLIAQAQATYQQALRVDPSYVPAYVRLACLSVVRDDDDEAATEHLYNYLENNGTFADADRLLTGIPEGDMVRQLLEVLKRQLLHQLGQISPALRRPAQAYFDDGQTCLSTNPEKALSLFKESMTTDPSFGLARLALGKVLSGMGEYEGALQQLEFATFLLPDNCEAWLLYAQRCVNLFCVSMARRAYYRACQLEPNNYEANLGLANANEWAKPETDLSLRATEASYLKTISIDPHQLRGHIDLARFYKASTQENKLTSTRNVILTRFRDDPQAMEMLDAYELL